MMKPYFVINIKNSPIPLEFDVYYLEAEHTSQALAFIEMIIDCLEVAGEEVKISVSLVELNNKQVKYMDEHKDGFYDIDEFNRLQNEE